MDMIGGVKRKEDKNGVEKHTAWGEGYCYEIS
jgi:hypothetical protein